MYRFKIAQRADLLIYKLTLCIFFSWTHNYSWRIHISIYIKIWILILKSYCLWWWLKTKDNRQDDSEEKDGNVARKSKTKRKDTFADRFNKTAYIEPNTSAKLTISEATRWVEGRSHVTNYRDGPRTSLVDWFQLGKIPLLRILESIFFFF